MVGLLMPSFEAGAFLNTVLKLTARDGNVAVLPESARFALGEKRVVRVVAPSAAQEEYCQAMDRVGVHCVPQQLAVSSSSGTWQVISQPDLDRKAELIGLYLSQDLGAATDAAFADIYDADTAGALFGYPACCVAAVTDLEHAGSRWPEQLVKQSGPPINWHASANRIVADWGGISPVGELFPCSLACEHAAQIGRSGVHALEHVGLHRLASQIVQDASRNWCLAQGRGVPSFAPNAYQLAWQ